MRPLALLWLLVGAGCAHGVSNEERLDAATAAQGPNALEQRLLGLDCASTSGAQAPSAARVAELAQAVKQFDAAFAQDADVRFGPRYEQLLRERDRCAAAAKAAKREHDFVEAGLSREPLPGPTSPSPPAELAAAAPSAKAPTFAKRRPAKKKKVAKRGAKRGPALAELGDELE